jgi:hypothetical protein
VDARETDDGATVYVAREEGERGVEGPFFAVYTTPERDRRYGWCCGNCGSLAVGMDTMGRIECPDCGNYRKPTEWDATSGE